MDFQETKIKEKQNSKLKTFTSSFIADALGFAAVLLTIISYESTPFLFAFIYVKHSYILHI